MPDARLQRTRETLPAGYQFGLARMFERRLRLARRKEKEKRTRAAWLAKRAGKAQDDLDEPGYGAGV